MNTNLAPKRDDLFFPLEQQFEKFFNSFFGKDLSTNLSKNGVYPKMNVYEKDREFVVNLAIPGMKENDLQVEVDSNNILFISGRMSEAYHSPSDAKVHLRELRCSTFERVIQLPDNVDSEVKNAVLKDGILTLRWKMKDALKLENKKLIKISSE